MPNGKRLDRRGRDLTSAQISAFEHRVVVSRPRPLTVIGEDIGVEVGRVWALADNTDFEAIPGRIADDTIGYIYGGAPLLLLGNQTEVVRGIREMLLSFILIAASMNQRSAPQEASL